jgi:hypothetical protein
MIQFLLLILSLALPMTTFATQYENVSLSCVVRGKEVSLNPEGKDANALKIINHPVQGFYEIRSLVYVSDSGRKVERPIRVGTVKFDVNLSPFTLPLISKFENPQSIDIVLANGLTSAHALAHGEPISCE